jgi:branched-subunit amino acid aminotransferase/4-amino-4-deoxychorismate lyase
MIDLQDRGLLLGDGLFETLLAVDGVLDHVEAHLDRMAAGCEVLGLPTLDRGLALQHINQAVAAQPEARLGVRLTLTAGSGGRGLDRPEPPMPQMFATAAAAAKPAGPAALIIAETRRNHHSASSQIKSLSYLDNILARREARAAGADEAVMLNGRGEIACATAANIFWITDEVLRTPRLDCGVLAGIMRGRVLAAAQSLGMATQEVVALPKALEVSDAVFLTNSLIGLRQAVGLGRAQGVNPVLSALSQAVSAR